MEKYGFKGVFFIMTITYNKKNYMTTNQIAELSKNGHTIGLSQLGSYTGNKIWQRLHSEKNIIEPRKKLEEIIGNRLNILHTLTD